MEPRISSILHISQQAIREIQREAAELIAIQVESEEDLAQYFELATFNPLNQAQRFRNLKEISSKDSTKTEEADETEESSLLDVAKVDEASERFEKNNYELNANTLKILRSQLSSGDDAASILKKVEAIYKDAALADEALDFLIETTDAQLQAATMEAKEKLNKDKGKEIRAGRNMGAQAREFAKEGLGSAQSLRDLYRDIIQNPRDPIHLFSELSDRFNYPKLKTVIALLLHALGSDLKAKGPSIERSELKRLIDEARSMQGILSVFRFFQSRAKVIAREFHSYDIPIPEKLDFEVLAKAFTKLISERFMNPEKILSTSPQLGLVKTAAQLVIYTQMRDALKQIAPKYFRDPKHRDELMKAFMDTVDQLEEKLEEEQA